MGEAIKTLEDEHLSSGSSRGSVLGSTMLSFPQGEKIITAARLMAGRARITAEWLTPWQDTISSMSTCLLEAGSLLSASDTHISSMSTCLLEMTGRFESRTVCLQSHMPSADTPEVKSAVELWQAAVLHAAVTVLQPVLNDGFGVTTLVEWHAGTEASMARVGKLITATEAMMSKGMLVEGPLLKNIIRCKDLEAWLAGAVCLLKTDDDGFAVNLTSQTLTLSVAEYRKQTKAVALVADKDAPGAAASQTLSHGICAMLSSPVFRNGGVYHNRVKQTLETQGAAALVDFTQQLQVVVSTDRLTQTRVFDIDKEDDKVVADILELQDVSEDAHAAAVQWAQDTHDGLLEVQIQICMLARAFIQSLAAGETLFRKFLRVEAGQPPRPMSQRSIRVEQVSVLLNMAACKDTFLGFVQENATASQRSTLEDALHLKILDNFIDLRVFPATVSDHCGRIFAAFATSWKADIGAIIEGINRWCPPWEPCRETLLSNREVVKNFMSMSDNCLAGIATFCAELRRQLDELAQVSKLKITEADFVIAAGRTVKFAAETVVYQELIMSDQVHWPKFKSPAECAIGVSAFKKKIEGKDVSLTDEMKKVLDDWASGAKLIEIDAATGAVGSSSTQQAPPSAPAVEPVAPPAVPPAGPGPVAPPGGAVPPPAEADPGDKRKALLQRARQAKQAKLL